MRKEVLIAIVIGIGLGAIVAFGVWRANLILGPKVKEAIQTPNGTNSPDSGTSSANLIITQPEDSTVFSNNSVTIKGSTIPNATVVLTSDEDEQVTLAGSDGTFEQDLTLASGPNNIVVTSYDDKGNQNTQKMTLVYSTEFPGGTQ
jgi:hypothetical protein